MKKITNLCMSAILTTSIFSGYALGKGLRKFRRRKLKNAKKRYEESRGTKTSRKVYNAR